MNREISPSPLVEPNQGAFAAILGNGKVVTWGDPQVGGDTWNLYYPAGNESMAMENPPI